MVAFIQQWTLVFSFPEKEPDEIERFGESVNLVEDLTAVDNAPQVTTRPPLPGLGTLQYPSRNDLTLAVFRTFNTSKGRQFRFGLGNGHRPGFGAARTQCKRGCSGSGRQPL